MNFSNDDTIESFIHLLRFFIRRKMQTEPHLNQADIAKLIEMSPVFLSLILAGKKKMPTKKIDLLISTLGLSEPEIVKLKLSMIKSKLGNDMGNMLSDCLKKRSS